VMLTQQADFLAADYAAKNLPKLLYR
jgi:hypothetical protein